MNFKNIKYLTIFGILISIQSYSQNKNIELDKSKIKLVNRKYISIEDIEPNVIALDAQNSSGLAIINNIEFESGIIEFDILGENNPGKSFVGIAFNIQNDTTYEAIYFRPFNFYLPK